MAEVEVKRIINLIPELLKFPYPRIWTFYDKEADVLYIKISRSQAMQMIPSSQMTIS